MLFMSDESEEPILRLKPRNRPKPEESKKAEPSSDAEPRLSLRPKSKPAGEATPPSPAAATDGPAEPKTRSKPKLSLKPKQDDGAQAKVEANLEEPPAAITPAPASAKPRLKPKLSISQDTEPAAEKPAETPSADEAPLPPATEEPPVADEKPPEATPSPTPPAAKPRLKLSASPSPAATSPASSPPPPVPDAAPRERPPSAPPMSTGSVPPMPMVTDDTGNPVDGSAKPIPPPPGLVGGGVEVPDDVEAPRANTVPGFPTKSDGKKRPSKRARPENRPAFKIAVISIVIVLLGVMGGGVYMAWNFFTASEEPPVVTTTETPAPTAATEPAESGPQSVAGQLIQKAQEAAAAHDAVGLDESGVLDDPAFAESDNMANQVTIDTSETAPVDTEIEPSEMFRAWVSAARISGVREGSEPRAFINGRLIRHLEELDHAQGIIFEGVDAERNLVIFKDATGAIIGKKY